MFGKERFFSSYLKQLIILHFFIFVIVMIAGKSRTEKIQWSKGKREEGNTLYKEMKLTQVIALPLMIIFHINVYMFLIL